MKRIIFAGAFVIAALTVNVPGARAQVGRAPWCAVISTGGGDVYWDCHYATLEECVPNVLAGNRGFCNYNPYYSGPAVTKTHRKRHSRAQ